MNRRTLLRAIGGTTAGTAGSLSLAGCLTQDSDENGNGETEENDDENGNGNGNGNDDDENETEESTEMDELEGELWVATYTSMVDDENPAGAWIKEAFEEEYPEVELEWTVPEGDVNHYVQRAQQEDEIEADIYLGLNVDDLVRIDDNLEQQLFVTLERDRLERVDRIRDDPSVEFDDPHDRVLPFDTGYISLVYDENEVDEPETFDDLLEPEYEDALLAQDARTSDPGQAFLLWTIAQYGEEAYLEYWRELADNGVNILGSWGDAYAAYDNEERPMVVSYSTDQVFTNMYDGDMSRSQIGFLEGQGYANPEGVGIFEDSDQTDLAYAFIDFLLSSEAQAEIAMRNVQFPAVSDEHVDLESEYTDYAHEPEEAVTLTYDELSGNLDEWVEQWAREVAAQ